MTSEIVQNHGDLLVFPPFAYPLMYIFSSFTANTLLVHKFKCLASFTKCTCSSLVFLHRFAVLRFGVLLWRPGFESWFQFGD